jgi:hypothetical protein
VELVRIARSKLPPPPETVDPFAPMNDQEAIRFEAECIEFGSHRGSEIGVVPCHYIGWLAENEFAIQLRRYVKSVRFRQRQDQEDRELESP